MQLQQSILNKNKSKNMTTLCFRKSIGRLPLWLAFFFIPLVLACSGAQSSYAVRSILDRLKWVGELPKPKAAKSAADISTIKKVEDLPAKRFIRASRRHTLPAIPLRGTLREYVAAVVSDHRKPNLKLTYSGFIPCSRSREHRCVAVVGDFCRYGDGDCEGMSLAVVIDITGAFHLDRAVASGYVVESQDDIEDIVSFLEDRY